VTISKLDHDKKLLEQIRDRLDPSSRIDRLEQKLDAMLTMIDKQSALREWLVDFLTSITASRQQTPQNTSTAYPRSNYFKWSK